MTVVSCSKRPWIFLRHERTSEGPVTAGLLERGATDVIVSDLLATDQLSVRLHRLVDGEFDPEELCEMTERELEMKRASPRTPSSDALETFCSPRHTTARLKFTCISETGVGVSFDLFGTLVDVEMPASPAAAVATELEARDVSVPADWETLYGEPHIDAPEGAEVPLPAHVAAALSSGGVEYEAGAVRRAVIAAFDPNVETRASALEAVAAAREHGPVALCSNCSVPELVPRTLIRSDLERDDFDVIVTSAGCGWRKPAPEIFETTAEQLEVSLSELVHVGDDPRTDSGIEAVGGRFVPLEEVRLADIPDYLEERR